MIILKNNDADTMDFHYPKMNLFQNYDYTVFETRLQHYKSM